MMLFAWILVVAPAIAAILVYKAAVKQKVDDEQAGRGSIDYRKNEN